MPFGSLNTTYRLGVANTSEADAFRWARQVLRLSIETFPQSFPVYQQQMVHAINRWEQGPASAAAEQCWDGLGDSEYGLANVIRQASAFDTLFSRRNVTPGIQNFIPFRLPPKSDYSADVHSNNFYGQVYFVHNEPEATSTSLGLPDTTEACSAGVWPWGPRNNTIDQKVDTLGVIPFSSFWEEPNGAGLGRHIRAQALALVFLRLKRVIEAKLRSHIVLPPVPSAPMLGAFGNLFWKDFYNAVRDGVTISAPTLGQPNRTEIENGVPPKDLKVLHFHYYSPPRDPLSQGNLPLESVAEGAYAIKSGVNWFRQQYNPGQPLDMDILVSEMGPLWQIAGDAANEKHKWAWAGGWNNFRDGLSWWNSWLCWLMRRAPLASECNLANSPNGNKTDAHALYACIHSPDVLPYCTTKTNGLFWNTNTTTRNQIFFHADNWAVGNVSGKDFIVSPQLNSFGRYQTSFSVFDPTNWDPAPGTTANTVWRIGPLGACYKVWSQIASDLLATSFGTGWYANSLAGVIGETTIDLPGGYSTVYFPIIKSFGTFALNTQIIATWRKTGRPDYVFGYFGAESSLTTEFPDAKNVTQIWSDIPGPYNLSPHTIPAQTIYSSMIFPVVCYSASPQTVTVRLSRNIGGAYVSLGRPVVLRQACSWLNNQ